MLKTALCRDLGIDHPIFCAGIGAASGPDECPFEDAEL